MDVCKWAETEQIWNCGPDEAVSTLFGKWIGELFYRRQGRLRKNGAGE